MKLYKSQFISMIIMVFLGVFIFIGINSEAYGMQKASSNYYNDSNLSNAWIYSENFTQEEENELLSLNEITETERRLQIKSALIGTEKNIQLNFVEKNVISKSFLVSGEEFDLNSDGIWLSDLFADKNNYKLNDYISFNYNGIVFERQIKGLIKNSEYIYNVSDESQLIPDYSTYGYAFLSYNARPEEIGIFNQILLKYDDLNKTQIFNIITEKLGQKPVIITTRNENISYQMFKSEIDSNLEMAKIFPVVFLLIAILTMITTMNRITTNEKLQIGTLKALGFKNSKILWHYTLYGIIVGVTGSILGIITGPILLGNFFIGFQKSTYDMPVWENYVPLYLYLIIILMILVLLFITFLSCKSMLKGTAAESLRPITPKKLKNNILAKTKLWNKLSFNAKWNLRDLMRNKIRSFITILGVAGGVMLMLCAFCMQNSLNDITKWMYEDIYNYKYKVNLNSGINEEEIINFASTINGDLYSENTIELKTFEGLKTARLELYNSERFVTFNDVNRNEINLNDNGVYITYKFSEKLNIKTGDTFSWRLYGQDAFNNVTVTGIIRTPLNQGFVMTYTAADKIGLNYNTTSILTNEQISVNYSTAISTVDSISDLKSSMSIMLDAMNAMVYIMIAGAVVLSVVVLYNLGILSYTERFRELSTLKVMGFTSKKLNYLIISQNLWLTIIGIIIGIPLGYVLSNLILKEVAVSMDIMTIISFLSYLICIVSTIAVSIFVSFILFEKTKNIDMVSALKSGE
jgi:putative ABC transport system permease protein